MNGAQAIDEAEKLRTEALIQVGKEDRCRVARCVVGTGFLGGLFPRYTASQTDPPRRARAAGAHTRRIGAPPSHHRKAGR